VSGQFLIMLIQMILDHVAPWHHFAALHIGPVTCQRQYGGKLPRLTWQWACRL
jgi:hypothetical protein